MCGQESTIRILFQLFPDSPMVDWEGRRDVMSSAFPVSGRLSVS